VNAPITDIVQGSVESYQAWNKPEKANGWRVTLPQTEAVVEEQKQYSLDLT
jgi:hypothetical protein